MRAARALVFPVMVLISLLALPGSARADSATLSYPAGWNMVGAPPGTNLSAEGTLYSYGATGYVAATVTSATLCAGYWAFFDQPLSATINGTPPSGQYAACTLQSGWNMVGNPFLAPANIPAGITAYHWNPSAARYDVVTSIPVGGAVWIYSGSVGTLPLQQGTSTPVGATLTITPPYATSYSAHVGDTIQLVMPSTLTYSVTYDPAFLQLQSTGTTSDGRAYFQFKALAAGATTLTLDPACRASTPPCEAPTLAIGLNISP